MTPFENIESEMDAQGSNILGDSLSWTYDGRTRTVLGFVEEVGDTAAGNGIDPMRNRWTVEIDQAQLVAKGFSHRPGRYDRIVTRRTGAQVWVPSTVSLVDGTFYFQLQKAS